MNEKPIHTSFDNIPNNCRGGFQTRPDLTVHHRLKRRLPVVAIDGPAGSGKSTVAKEAAKRLGFQYLDTGAMYRTATLISMETGISPDEPERLTAEIALHQFNFDFRPGYYKVELDGRDVSEAIRLPELTRSIGPVCEIPGVRKLMGELQRRMGANGGVVLEGRDIGTVIFPNAEVKIFLTASAEIRARRRWLEQQAKGIELDFQTVFDDVVKRDQRDIQRDNAPLKPADDAMIIDTSGMSIEEVIDKVVILVKECMKRLSGEGA